MLCIAASLGESHLLDGAFEQEIFDHSDVAMASAAVPANDPYPAVGAQPARPFVARFGAGNGSHADLQYATTHHGAALLCRKYNMRLNVNLASYSQLPINHRVQVIYAARALAKQVSSCAFDWLEFNHIQYTTIHNKKWCR